MKNKKRFLFLFFFSPFFFSLFSFFEGLVSFFLFFFSDGTIILLPHPGTTVIVDAVKFSLPSFCPASRCATLSSG